MSAQSKRIAKARTKAGLTQEVLAKRLKVEENFQDEDGLSGEDDEDDISVDLSTWTENEWNDFFDYDRSVDDCNDEEENKEENKKWMKPSSQGTP